MNTELNISHIIGFILLISYTVVGITVIIMGDWTEGILWIVVSTIAYGRWRDYGKRR